MSEQDYMLGVDIGFVKTGWALGEIIGDGEYHIRAVGCIATERDAHKKALRVADSDVERCQIIVRELMKVIHEHQPRSMVVELPHGGARGARALRCMGMATALAAAMAEFLALPVEWVTPGEVKKAVVGKRSGSKDSIKDAVRADYPEIEWPNATMLHEHIADAVGALLVVRHGNNYRMFEP
jgi:Holliday junction resolvasome RuvABC endonuclease subunit